jgi:MFS family permease
VIEGIDRTVRRNTFVLALAMALNWSVITLFAALTALTIGSLFGMPELAGAGFALASLAIGSGSVVVGRLMDRLGRRNALIVAFLVGAGGALLIFAGVGAVSIPVALAGLLVTSFAVGGANLARVAGADMFPPARRPRGIALILFGAAFGALGAPIVFSPMLPQSHHVDAAALAAPWTVAAGIMLAGAVLLLAIRTDPRAIAEQLRTVPTDSGSPPPDHQSPARPLRSLLSLPMVPLALLAAFIAQGVMTTIMALSGLVLHQHGHDPSAITLTVSFHFVGMFGLVLVVGRLVEAFGRFRSVLVGLIVLAGGALLMMPGVSLVNFIPGMFLVGVGWNIAFVASTTILADAARPAERGRLLGFSDFLALLGSASMALLGGIVLSGLGLTAMLIASVALCLVPAALIALNRTRLEGAPAAS